jgi:HPt (histidine-containing phosphotransfer) domain-containing protein
MMINWARLLQLQEDVGKNDIHDIIILFEQELKQVIAQLPLQTDPEQMASNLHYLKGCALNLGFEDLADLCQAGYTRLSQSPRTGVTVAPILSAYEAAINELHHAMHARLG